MKKNETILELAGQIIENEAAAVLGLKRQINDGFQKTVELLLENKGNLVFTGIGFALGGTVGIGTIICAFCVGPVANFFFPTVESAVKKLTARVN